MKMYVWAQALDNLSDDHFWNESGPLEESHRPWLLEECSRVRNDATVRYETERYQFYILGPELMAEIHLDSDDRGRVAPLMLLVQGIDGENSAELTSKAKDVVLRFREEIGRDYDDLHHFGNLLSEAQKKSRNRALARYAAAIGLAVMAGLTLYWLRRGTIG